MHSYCHFIPLLFILWIECLQLAADTDAVWKLLRQIAAEHDVPCKSDAEPCEEEEAPCLLTFQHAQEVTRYGGAELHNISSLLGGVAAQVSLQLPASVTSLLCAHIFAL